MFENLEWGKNMQVIRFTYDRTEVDISVFLSLYLRVSGIYVSNRYSDLEPVISSRMLDALPDETEKETIRVFDRYDMELYLVQTAEAFLKFQQYGYTKQTIVLLPDIGEPWTQAGEVIESQTVRYSQGQDRAKMLNALLECMYQNHLITYETLESLRIIADIYCTYKIPELLFRTKYFYISEDEQNYNRNMQHYQKVIDALFHVPAIAKSEWGDVSKIHIQYAALYLSYEGDLYCSRHVKPFIYTPESIAAVCVKLLSNKDVVFFLGDSINLLTAQVYGDLLRDSYSAYTYYLAACKEYSAYAYYKKATHLMEWEHNYEMAIRYLSRSLKIYPSYYRAWHMLGICYMNQQQWQKAVAAFDNLEIIISPRLKQNSLRTTEFEYLFKAASQSGDILFDKLHQIPQAAQRYLLAERVWKAVDETRFMSFICEDSSTEDSLRQRVKKELNIRNVYTRLSEFYQLSGDKEKAAYYLDAAYTQGGYE